MHILPIYKSFYRYIIHNNNNFYQDHIKPNWLAIPLMTERRFELLTFLENNGIQTRVCFSGNITRHPAYRQYLHEYPVSDRNMKEAFLLGAHHGMTIDDVDYVCSKIKEFFIIN